MMRCQNKDTFLGQLGKKLISLILPIITNHFIIRPYHIYQSFPMMYNIPMTKSFFWPINFIFG